MLVDRLGWRLGGQAVRVRRGAPPTMPTRRAAQAVAAVRQARRFPVDPGALARTRAPLSAAEPAMIAGEEAHHG
jgi:hypothetical protein